jgi:hypothetical protein
MSLKIQGAGELATPGQLKFIDHKIHYPGRARIEILRTLGFSGDIRAVVLGNPDYTVWNSNCGFSTFELQLQGNNSAGPGRI